MAFCENCGKPLEKGIKFCENCGAPVANEDKGIASKFFLDHRLFEDNSNWKKNWATASSRSVSEGHELGIIITNADKLSRQLNCEVSAFNDCIDSYVVSASARGVDYFLYDTQLDDVQKIINALREVVDIARPKYLLILGNEEIIPVACWTNEAGDRDEVVSSDIAYSLLDGTSPWEGQNFNLSSAMRVGRVPNYDNQSLSDFFIYFDNVVENNGTLDSIKSKLRYLVNTKFLQV